MLLQNTRCECQMSHSSHHKKHAFITCYKNTFLWISPQEINTAHPSICTSFHPSGNKIELDLTQTFWKSFLAAFASSASHKFVCHKCGYETTRTFTDVTALFFAVHVNGEKLRGLVSNTVSVRMGLRTHFQTWLSWHDLNILNVWSQSFGLKTEDIWLGDLIYAFGFNKTETELWLFQGDEGFGVLYAHRMVYGTASVSW